MIDIKDCWLRNRCKLQASCPDPCIKLIKTNALCEKALLSNKQRQHIKLVMDGDKKDSAIFSRLHEIEMDIENKVASGINLYIYSNNVGNGKTSWGLRLLNSYINSIWAKSDLTCRALFINVPSFLLGLKSSISAPDREIEYIKQNIIDADIVLFDEIGIKTATQFEFEHLLSIINTRLNKGRANIYTSNIHGSELEARLGDRLYSRIINNSECLEIKGRDKRGIV